jgi:WD40 repeat protein
MHAQNQVCFLCDSEGTIKRCVCDRVCNLIGDIQHSSKLRQDFLPLQPPSALNYESRYVLPLGKGVNYMCASGDGRWVVSGTSLKFRANLVKIWNMRSFSQVAELKGHTCVVFCLCVSVDSRWIATGSGDATVRIWSIENPSQVAVLRGHADDVYSVCFSKDNRWIV